MRILHISRHFMGQDRRVRTKGLTDDEKSLDTVSVTDVATPLIVSKVLCTKRKEARDNRI